MDVQRKGQSLLEFALILPLMVLIVLGIFELGRAFFAFIAISNAAREGARIYTFTPDDTTYYQITSTVKTEAGTTTLIDISKITSIEVRCDNGYTLLVTNTAGLANCLHEQPFQVTVTYQHSLILGLLFPQPITIKKSAEMMKP